MVNIAELVDNVTTILDLHFDPVHADSLTGKFGSISRGQLLPHYYNQL